MKLISLQEIQGVLPSLDLIPAIEDAFVRYSAGEAVVPPVGELLLEKGEVHIKYGCLREDPYYVIKIASGFYGNPKIGLPSGNGLMLLFGQETGELVSVLVDEGHLTDTRTAVAGAVAAKHLGPERVEHIGIVGTGTQARLQLEYLKQVTACTDVLVWGRGEFQLARYRREMEPHGFTIRLTRDAAELLRTCDLVVTTTPATSPLLHAADLRPGTHITAVGSDTPHKQELDSAILRRADMVVADSIAQCLLRGEIHQAIDAGVIAEEDVVELGDVIAGRVTGRMSQEQITVADLTGVAVQDIAIAAAVHNALGK
ncbi:MAG: ornithine cyclodeaminase family protein [Gemmatimonadales bacterium]|nr:ornithine cyclodeaminase family protein [Gemmatimonadales bacterium]NIN11161.1 ornithine cyclodeaminase family protein [Gemmatimonadales bacterium]NIN49760.1 ornithine cyclodeaminase family protein [Gemmatimonadales bacterium]NIP07224.1 ornithine cyclodeaminase family protein [Gemmatimonadales bacterium]NIR00437.1 ornithine cyclodeaminase family protein [Gemmatimonadales bacterium]